jgi:hypothetical protein
MYRDGEGRLHARNPEPGCLCALPPETVYTIDRPPGSETWYAWEGTAPNGHVIATGDLEKVLRAVERREAA